MFLYNHSITLEQPESHKSSVPTRVQKNEQRIRCTLIKYEMLQLVDKTIETYATDMAIGHSIYATHTAIFLSSFPCDPLTLILIRTVLTHACQNSVRCLTVSRLRQWYLLFNQDNVDVRFIEYMQAIVSERTTIGIAIRYRLLLMHQLTSYCRPKPTEKRFVESNWSKFALVRY